MVKFFVCDEWMILIFIGDDELQVQYVMIVKYGFEDYFFINGFEVGQVFVVGKFFYVVLFDIDGVILLKGFVNSCEYFESLVIVYEMGVWLVQDYIVLLFVKVV